VVVGNVFENDSLLKSAVFTLATLV